MGEEGGAATAIVYCTSAQPHRRTSALYRRQREALDHAKNNIGRDHHISRAAFLSHFTYAAPQFWCSMDRDGALWQAEVRDDQQELGLACYLFEASTAAFSALLKVLAADLTKPDAASYRVLCNEFRKYYMWNEGFSTRSGGLDHALARSRNLKAIVLKLMAQWARAVCRGDVFR